MPDTDPELAALPLDQQLRHLQAQLAARRDARALLLTCAAVRDHAPLSWLARQLLERGWLADPEQRPWFADFLLQQPETAVDRVLKALIGDGTFDAIRGPQLRDTLLTMLQLVTVDRVSVMCLVDRALKHNFATDRDAHVEEVRRRCEESLRHGRAHEVTIDLLAQVSAPGIATLREHAIAHAPATAAQLEQTLEALAQRALQILGQAPKAISQANAEELLSKRVYTDPGHFLVELLQNAEDAGAVRFKLEFGPRRIVLWHDGIAFDTRDVVGVTSIGQTTKRKQQIGFFGVGFKSVYEVTDRPQIYSDVYRFEIADVSIPKLLAGRPDDVPPDGTVLVLPLRDPADPDRSPAALFTKARDLDAIVLFTLRRIDVIDLSLHHDDGTTTRHAVHELAPDARGISRIRQEPEGWVRGYAVHDAEHVYHAGGRAPGRADRTRVMVGVRVDEHGVPRTLEDDTPTIYSYLPTEEHSGLRFFVQGHFDVPVDRERITQDSRWNEWILSKVAPGLSALARQLTVDHPPELQQRVAQGLLCVLPLAAELGSPIFRHIVRGLRGAFARLPIVPGEDGELHPAPLTLLMSSELAALFEGQPVRMNDEVRAVARRDLDPRAAQVAGTLGAAVLEPRGLVELLERELASVADGSCCEDPAAPLFLRAPTGPRMAACYEILGEAMMRRSVGGPRLPDSTVARRLAALPLVLGEGQSLHRAGPAIVRAGPALREIYAELRSFVDPLHDAAVDAEDPARVAATAFLDRLGVPCLGVRDLVADLHAQLGQAGPVADLAATRFPGTPSRLRAVIQLLADAPAPVQRRAAQLPIFAAQDGRYHRSAQSPGDRQGVLLYEPGAVGEQLLAYYGHSRPVYVPVDDDPALELLRNARTPTLSLGTLVAELEQREQPLALADLDRLHALLEAVRDELPARARRQLAELPIWPDTHGRCRPLRGEDAVRLPGSPAIAALLPAVPFLHPDVLGRRHAHDMGGEEIGLDGLVDALAVTAVAPLRIEPTAESATTAMEILCAHSDAIHPRLRARLAKVPLFLDDQGHPQPLEELCIAQDPALREVYGSWPRRHFVDPQSFTRSAIGQLDLDARLERIDATTLTVDLGRLTDDLDGHLLGDDPLPLVGDADHLLRLLEYCASQAPTLPRTVVLQLTRAAIFPDGRGCLGALADARQAPEATAVHACELKLWSLFDALGARVLAPRAQAVVEPLIEASARGQLEIVALVQLLSELPSVASGQPRAAAQTPERLAEIHTALVDGVSVLAHRFGPQPREGAAPSSPMVGGLAVWPTLDGGVIAADQIVASEALAALLPPGTPARAGLDAVTPHPNAAVPLAALAPLVQPGSAEGFAAQLVGLGAVRGEPLAAQPPVLQDLDRIARLFVFIGPEHDPRPLVAADGRLHLPPLGRTSADTVALLHSTAMAAQILHPTIAAHVPDDPALPQVEPAAVVDALIAGHTTPAPMAEHPVLHDPATRQRLYAWIVAHESEVFTDAEARARLRSQPLLPTDRGTLRPADQLVVDPDLPDLDVDWTPHSEIPAQTLALLVRHLGIGRPPVEDLVQDHLAPAYRGAAARGDGVAAARVLEYLSRALSTADPQEVRSLLAEDGPVLIEGAHGRFVPAQTLLLPPPALASAVEAVFGTTHPGPHTRLDASTHGLLTAVGVRRTPPLAWIADAMRGGVASTTAATGMALLVAHVHREDPAATLAELPLRDCAWVLDGNAVPRRPPELFAWTTDVQALVGDSPGLYPDPEITRALGDPLCDALQLRTTKDVRLHEVVAHIDASRDAGVALPFVVYRWLERGLAEGWLDAAALHRQLGERAWVCSDDGEYYSHQRVLGVRALEHFGQRRGYWERGVAQCPTLCRRFGIGGSITVEVRLAFLEEIAADAEARGDEALLAAEPGLARMLLRAYAGLGGEAKSPTPSLILARRCGQEPSGQLRLRPPDDPVLLRSDAPALEALFASTGEFFVAAPGPRDDRPAIDAFHERCGIRRLRETYQVQAASAGQDETAAHPNAIAGLRVTLRGLLAALARVRLQRTHLAADAWVYEQRLAPLASTGPIHAHAGLHVDYVLPGVGRARSPATAVYDPGSTALLVDTAVLLDPQATVTGLAQGLMACIYDGADEEQLVDIVEILLRLADRPQMEAYLDQRFFPTADPPAPDDGGQLAARVGELFDYGLDRRLVARFPELEGCPLSRWRDPSLFASVPVDREQAVRTVVARMLAAVELSEASQPLAEALALLLSAPSLSDVPAGLLAPSVAATALEPASIDAQTPNSWPSEHAPSLEELEARLAALTADQDPSASSSGASAHRFVIPGAPVSTTPDVVADLDADDRSWMTETAAEAEASEASASAPAEGGFWRRLARRLGLADDTPVAEPLPSWAEPGANVLEPSSHVEPQLWVRGPALREMVTERIPMGMLHQPRVLPAPHRYVVHTLASVFDPSTQRWSPGPLPRLTALFDGEPSGHSVAFAGSLAPGRSVLPVPLFGDITRLEVIDADPSSVRPRGRLVAGSAVVDVEGSTPVQIRYEVSLRRPPTLTEDDSTAWEVGPPTLPREALPRPVRTWVERNLSAERGVWEQARRVEAFVQRHYTYDLDFRERPAVQRAARELVPGAGCHHLALLHASAEGSVLGRGVCYELNVLVVELLRHLGIPSLVATGWMLDEGFAARPDHLFALALVPTAAGPCLMPLDASTGPGGHVRPLAGAHPPTVDLQPPPRQPIPMTGGGWAASVLAGPEREATFEEHVHEIHRDVRAQLDREREALRRVIRIADAAAGREADPLRTDYDDVEALRRFALAAVGHRTRLSAMLAVIRGDYDHAAVVPETVQALVRDGLATVHTYPSYRVRPSDERND